MSKPAQQNDPRTRDYARGGVARVPRAPPSSSARCLPPHVVGRCEPRLAPHRGVTTNPGANRAKENPTRERAPAAPDTVRGRDASPSLNQNLKRLSATDISALASMKNVAKCDTWCELQNPVNHRVFERKLRPKPLGRGHVCLGVTHRCPPQPPLGGPVGGRKLASRALPAHGWPKFESSATVPRRSVVETSLSSCRRAPASPCHGLADPLSASRSGSCSLRDPRSGGTTR